MIRLHPDLGVPDLGVPDLGVPDLGVPDLGVPDLGVPDLGVPDLGVPDLGVPDLGVPDLGVPDLGVPDLGVPDLGVPDLGVPDLGVPDLGVPDLGVPDLGVPDLGVPDLGVPDLGVPDLGVPDLGVPDLGVPDLGVPDLGVPDLGVPDLGVPDLGVPDLGVPDLGVPDLGVPDLGVPDLGVPDLGVPDLGVPDLGVPDLGVPDLGVPDLGVPDLGVPDLGVPDLGVPDLGVPDLGVPDLGVPDLGVPDLGVPDLGVPDLGVPDLGVPDLGVPDLGVPDLGVPDLGVPDLGVPDLGVPDLGVIVHGGALAEARRAFAGAPEPFIDLSTGINPVAYPVPTLDAACFARLPEPPAMAALLAAAAQAYAVADPAPIVAAPGTQSLIQLLPRLVSPTRVAVLAPTYAEHAAAWRAAGHAVRDIASLDTATAEDRVIVLCNPNNPDGRCITAADLRARAATLGRSGGLLLVDEAFADFEPEGLSVAAEPAEALVVLRSFGKAYGLAGIRLGFAIASPEWARPLRAALGPWAVSGPAIAIGTAALADLEWRRAAALRLSRDAARLDMLLRRAGLEVLGGTSLFRLARHPKASDIFMGLGRAGLLVRRFVDHPGWLRFGIPGSDAVFDRLRQAIPPL